MLRLSSGNLPHLSVYSNHHTPPLPSSGPQVKSTKMNRTIVVRRDYLHYIKKYQVRCAC